VKSISSIATDYNQEQANLAGISSLQSAVPTLKTAESMNYVLAAGLITGLVIQYFTMGKDIRRPICGSKSHEEQ